MPAGSDEGLPRTFRPFGVRVAAGVLGLLLAATAVVMWVAFPPHIRAQFTTFQVLTIFALAALFYGAGYALARSRVVARADGLVVVNGYRRRHFDWNQVVAVSLRPGSPWAVLDLSDGTTCPVMGIQGSDGARARAQARALRALVERMSG